MAESYISRRGGSGGSEVAIYTGSSLPSAKTFGIYANTGSNTVSNIISEKVEVSSGGTVTAYQATTTRNNTRQCGISVDNTIAVIIGSNTDAYPYNTYKVSLSTGVVTESNHYSVNKGTNTIINKGDDVFLLITGVTYESGEGHYQGVIYEFSSASSTLTRKLSTFDVTRGPCDARKYGSNFALAGYGAATSSSSASQAVRLCLYNATANTISVVFGQNTTGYYGNTNWVFCENEWYCLSATSSGNNRMMYRVSVNNPTAVQITTHSGSVGIGNMWYFNGYLYSWASNIFNRLNLASDTTSWEPMTTTGVFGTTSMHSIVDGVNAWCGGPPFYKYTMVSKTYPVGTVVIDPNVSNNVGTIISDKTHQINMGVNGIYYSNGTTLTKISGSVRVVGGSWTTIV